MGQPNDPGNTFSAMHHKMTGDLLHLMDGFYSNIEDGLFELAFRNNDHSQRKRCFDLMREMRYRRGSLIQTFAKRLQRVGEAWTGESQLPAQNPDLAAQAKQMAEKCHSHFGPLLRSIRERAAYGSDQEVKTFELPVSPYQVSYQFVASCQSLDFDKQAIDIVQNLFARFVLDRMGGIYGDCNRALESAGFYTQAELQEVSAG